MTDQERIAEIRGRCEAATKQLRELLPDQVDYAELVASPVPSSYGIRFVWDSPEPYAMENAANLIEELMKELTEAQRREQAAVDMLIKMGFCSQRVGAICDYQCDEENPMACHACIGKYFLQEAGEKSK